MAATAATRARVRDDLARVVHRSSGLPAFARDLGRTLRRAVPFEGVCLLTVDPATLLPTAEIVQDGLPPAARERLTEIELGEPDVNKFAALAGAPVPAASLSAATGGELDRSRRQREVRGPNGFADELRAVLTGPTGSWGTLTLLREARRPHFTAAEVGLVASLAATLADGVRRAVLVDAGVGDGPDDTGFLVLAADNTVELANPAAERWVEELSAPGPAGPLPVAIRSVAARTRLVAAGDRNVLASARIRTRAGRWVVVRGSLAGPDQVVVLLEAARPAELAEVVTDAYGFTERERMITTLVARGLSTAEIAARLHLSAYTVQDHLKAIFDKSGTSSRGQLVSRLFLDR
ncbi:MAG TPA: LuxR C-terminal-related transcriptional regulator [Mycobacteriales bacterium]